MNANDSNRDMTLQCCPGEESTDWISKVIKVAMVVKKIKLVVYTSNWDFFPLCYQMSHLKNHKCTV